MAWSSVKEQITDGTSGLAPNSGAIALVIGTSSKGGLCEIPERIRSLHVELYLRMMSLYR